LTFSEEPFVKDYVKELKDQKVEQELKALRKLKDLEKKYQLEKKTRRFTRTC